MAGYLRFDGVDDAAISTLPASTINANLFKVELDFVSPAYTTPDRFIYALRGGGSIEVFITRDGSSRLRLRITGFGIASINHFVNYNQTQRQTFSFEVNRVTGDYEGSLNGTPFITSNKTDLIGVPIGLNRGIGAAYTGGTSVAGFLNPDIYRVSEFVDNVETLRYEPVKDDETANALLDKIGNNDSTFIGNPQFFDVSAIPSITDVDTDEALIDGQTGVSITTSDFSGNVTAVNLKVGTDRVALTNLSGTGDSYTANLMDVTALTSGTVGLPFSSATYQNEIEATDGTDTAVINITRNPKAGWEVVDVVDAVNTEGSTFENRVGGAPSNASQILYPTANGTSITATGIITTDAQEVDGYLWNVTSGEWETWSVDFPLPDTTTSTAQVTITGIANGTHAIKLWNDATNAILFNGNLTFTDTTATTSLDVAAGTVFVGRWLGDNPPTTGTGIYGVTV